MKTEELALAHIRGWHASAASMPEASWGLEEGWSITDNCIVSDVVYSMYLNEQDTDFGAGLGGFAPLP